MLEEFKKFAMRGNVVDLAVGVIIGAAFGKIVESLVGDLFMPLIGAVTGGLDFSNYFVALAKSVTAPALADAKKQGAVLAWGNFVTIVINFVIIAFVLGFIAGFVLRAYRSHRRRRWRAASRWIASPPLVEEDTARPVDPRDVWGQMRRDRLLTAPILTAVIVVLYSLVGTVLQNP